MCKLLAGLKTLRTLRLGLNFRDFPLVAIVWEEKPIAAAMKVYFTASRERANTIFQRISGLREVGFAVNDGRHEFRQFYWLTYRPTVDESGRVAVIEEEECHKNYV